MRHHVRRVGQLVEVGGEQRPAAHDVVEVLKRGLRYGQTIVGRRAPPHLVQDDKRAARGLVQDGRGLQHLDHERAPPCGQVVRRADAAEQLVHHADPGLGSRDERSDLGHEHDDRDLPQEGGLARHVRAGQQPETVCLAHPAVVGHEGAALGLQQRLRHWVPALPDVQPRVAGQLRLGPVAFGRGLGKSRHEVQGRRRVRDLGQHLAHGQDGR